MAKQDNSNSTQDTLEKKEKKAPSTQKYLDINEIRDDCVILKDGSLRTVILVSSINFALKSEDEQEAIIQSYVSFLNVLNDFPLQIVIQSRPLSIDAYIAQIEDIQRKQENELMKMQTTDYLEFIKELVKMGEIMSKKFFVIVPYNPTGDTKMNFFSRLYNAISPVNSVRLDRKRFDKYRAKLFKRVDFVQGGLQSMGLKSTILDTQSLIELFYNIYNPTTSPQQPIAKNNKLNFEEE
ncbi:MAG: TraC family protein [Patescibacteria group bacterium]|jgi:hypothetical protein|nr:TraC family protein [Patescibacteria group bacterium]